MFLGCSCTVSLSIFNVIFGLLLAAIFYRIYFDRELKNHSYLFWYGTWFAVGATQIFIFEYLSAHGLLLSFPYGIVYFFLSFAQSIILLMAALKFSDKHLATKYLYALMIGFAVHIIGLYHNNLILLGIANIADVGIMLFNLVVLSKVRYKVLRAPLFLSWFGWVLLEYKIFIPGDTFLFVSLASINVALTSLTILGIHLHRLQLERDCYKIKFYRLKESLSKIDKLELKLIQLVSMLSE